MGVDVEASRRGVERGARREDQAKRVADAAKARVIVPMHYRHGEFGLRPVGTLDEFTRLFPDVTRLDGNEFTLTVGTPVGVVVPKYVRNAKN